MVITINKKTSIKEIKKAVSRLSKKRGDDASVKDFYGKLKRELDGIAFQKKKRDEWN
ncbi:MAG: hypothetical protein R2739_06170 [Chitinophagales bacterium]|nr:hypothetical protein [Bacteroidota bacterium]